MEGQHGLVHITSSEESTPTLRLHLSSWICSLGKVPNGAAVYCEKLNLLAVGLKPINPAEGVFH